MGKQESVSDWFQMSKDYAKAENELKIEKWVQITIEYNDEVKHEPVRLFIYDGWHVFSVNTPSSMWNVIIITTTGVPAKVLDLTPVSPS